LSALAPSLGAAPQEDGPEDLGARSFSIPSTHYANSRFEKAENHIAGRRWSDAISELQVLIEEHEGDVLAGRRVDRHGESSQFLLHPGAAASARARLMSLPEEARSLYAARYGAPAQDALERARARLDRGALVEVARRWPATPAAPQAWWALGDLELELGNLAAAREAWRRAAELTGDGLSEGAARRLAWSASLDSDAGAAELFALSPETAQLRLPGPGDATGTLPGPKCHTWQLRIGDETDSPFFGMNPGESYNLFPIVYGDTVLVSTSLRLWAVDAFSSSVIWKSAEPPGWDQVRADEQRRGVRSENTIRRNAFFEGIDRSSLMIAPAAAGGIVVCALQIPVTQLGNTLYQNQIRITTILPDRRLFAFDVETGAPLWRHLPPPMWDGESGSFSERMRVAGPPVIAGTRVLVPVYRPQGRIDYHVACYDLATGAYLWSTALISGQVPLNMFGRPEQEFSAPPLRVEGDRVIALTQLGAIAALDLFTGDILWESLYDQIVLPRANGFKPGARARVWKNAPPVVSGRIVIATPTDSHDMVGLDLETGCVMWSIPHTRLDDYRRFSSANLALLGASEDTIYLGGRSILAMRAPGGLGSGAIPYDALPGHSVLDTYSDPSHLPRPVLAERHVLVPTLDQRLALDRFDLTREDQQFSDVWGDAGIAARGNALLAGGALYTLTGKYLTAFFDWNTIEARLAQKYEADPGNVEIAAEFGSFMAERARAEWKAVRPAQALAYIARARQVLEPLLPIEGGPPENGITERMHRVLRLEASVLVDDAQSPAALERLERARGLAPDLTSLRDTLLEIASIHKDRDPQRWFEVLSDLYRDCGDLKMPEEPILGMTLTHAGEGSQGPVSVGLWVLSERSRVHAFEHDTAAELEDLHAVLERFGDAPVWRNARAESASERIRDLLDEGAEDAYAPFEHRAQALLDQALAREDAPMIERVTALYPHSAAARAARNARLEAAFERADLATVASVVLEELPDSWSAANSTEREARLALLLARTIEKGGNLQYSHSLLRSLARTWPRLRSELPGDGGRSLAELAAELPPLTPARLASEDSDFDTPSVSLEPLPGDGTELVGVIPESPRPFDSGEEPGDRTLVFVRGERLTALSASDPSRILWWFPHGSRNSLSELASRTLLTSQRVIMADFSVMRAVDSRTGSAAWIWAANSDTGGALIEEIVQDAGVVVAVLRERDKGMRLVGRDAVNGTELWQRELHDGLWSEPVTGEGKLVLLPRGTGQRALVLEIATGTEAMTLEIGQRLPSHDRRGAWIENGFLIVPHFTPPADRSRSWHSIDTWDLNSDGRPAWHVAADDACELDSIARVADKTYLILIPPGDPSRPVYGSILQLDTRIGSHAPVQGVRLSAQDTPIDLRPNSVTRLERPFLFVRSQGIQGEILVHAIHLPGGNRWTHRLPTSEDDLFVRVARPALSKNLVALAYTQDKRTRAGRPRARTQLLLLDRRTGMPRDTLVLPEEIGPASDVEMITLGDCLVICGQEQISLFGKER
jgi:outer membrane protein assembly factor BamB